MDWNGWPMERILMLMTSLGFLSVGIQVWMFHYRQNFHKKVMYVPVILSPIVFITGISYVLSRSTGLLALNTILLWVGVVSGVIGFVFHYRGVGVRVGGYELRNFLMGPPIILPLLLTAFGFIGLIGLYWG